MKILLFLFCSLAAAAAQTQINIEAFKKAAEQQVENGEDLKIIRWTKGPAVLDVWLEADGKVFPRQDGAHYLFLVLNPEGKFLRKAWLAADGQVISEEQRTYDERGWLESEAIINPTTGAKASEYRHRYSSDGKKQFSKYFEFGAQIGEETERALEE